VASQALSYPLCAQGHLQPQLGGRFCVHCGSALLPAAVAGAPACAVHPQVLAEQACARCGNFACHACLRTVADGSQVCASCEARGAAVDLPWDQRDRLGTVSSFVRTCWMIATSPVRTLDRARPEGGMGSSLLFAVLADFTTALTTLLVYGAVLVAFLATSVLGAERGQRSVSAWTTAGITAGAIILLALTFLLATLGGTLLASALDHLVLKMVGANPRSFQVTLRAHVLSLAPCLIGVIPFCGLYVVPVWAAILRIYAYRGMHRISTGKAVAGALAVPAAAVALAVLAWLVGMIMALSFPGT